MKSLNHLRSVFFVIIFIFLGCEDKIQEWNLLVTVSPIEAGIVVAVDNGTVTDTLQSSQKFDDGTEINIAAVVPEIGWEFDHWEGDLSGSDNPTTITMDGNKSITAVFVKLQYPLTITITGEGEVTEEIVVAKTADYDHGSNIRLTAIPDTGWEFDHWEGDLSGSDNPTTITMDGNKSITAVFVQIPYSVNLTITGNGTVTKNPDQVTYYYNTTVQLTATPDAGWIFEKWQGDLSGNTNPFNITVQSNISLEAVFVQVHTLSVAVIGDGSITKTVGSSISQNLDDQIFKHNTPVQIGATADPGWTFDHWEGDLTGATNPTSITMNADKSVTAVFTQNQYSLSIVKVGSGTVTTNPNQASYLYNQDVILTATPSTDWLFSNWTGDISSSSNPKTIKIIKNTSVTAKFVKISDGLSTSLGACVIMFNFIYEICSTLTNELPVGVTVNKVEFFNGSNAYVNGTSDPSYLNNNWLPANSELRIGLSFSPGQANSYFSGWKVVWSCSYGGKNYYVTGYYGLGKVSADKITLPLVSYSIIECD